MIKLFNSALSKLKDDIFLEIASNFLGKVTTPFHKPQIIGELATLFSCQDFTQKVFSTLSTLDCQILSATYLANGASWQQICEIFKDEIPYVVLQQQVVNLQERLLLLLYNSDNEKLNLNPILEKELTENYLSFDLIVTKKEGQIKQFDRRLLKALFSLHFHQNLGSLNRSEVLLQRKYADEIFTEPIEVLYAYNRLLYRFKCVTAKGKRALTNPAAFDSLLSMSDEQLSYLVFSSSFANKEESNLRVFYETMVQLLKRSGFVDDLFFLRLIKIASIYSNCFIEDLDATLKLLKNTVIGKKQESLENTKRVEPTIDTDLTLFFSGDIEPIDNKELLHYIALVEKVDIITSYALSKKSLLRAFDAGFTVGEILDYLNKLVKVVPKSLKHLLNQWHDEFSCVTLYDGIVVKTDNRVARIVQNLPKLKEHLLATIGENIFLFNRETEVDWRQMLLSSGFDFLPSSIPKEVKEPPLSKIAENYTVKDKKLNSFLDSKTQKKDVENLSFKEELHSLILKKKFPKEKEEYLLARLERNLILTENQITQSAFKTQIMEAKGFDYQGKINLCKAAVNSETELVELTMLNEKGKSQILMAQVKEFIKESDNPAIRVLTLPEEKELLISINKIFKVRKLKRSIFF